MRWRMFGIAACLVAGSSIAVFAQQRSTRGRWAAKVPGQPAEPVVVAQSPVDPPTVETPLPSARPSDAVLKPVPAGTNVTDLARPMQRFEAFVARTRQESDAFVARTQEESDQAIEALAKEAQRLNLRLKEVNAALTKWKQFSSDFKRQFRIAPAEPGGVEVVPSDANVPPLTQSFPERRPLPDPTPSSSPEPPAPGAN